MLVSRGCRVYAPSLPGFGGNPPLPADQRTVAGYGEWAAQFLDAVDVGEAVLVVGHSFGGGVAVTLAHGHPELVRSLVLLNSVGGGRWQRAAGRPGYLGGRPVWSWTLQLARELLPPQRGVGLIVDMWYDVASNLVRNPCGLWEIGRMAAGVDLLAELADLASWEIPILALRGHADGVVPRKAFEAVCAALGREGSVIRGNHCFLLADPASFDEVMANVLAVGSGSATHPLLEAVP
jgi:pimeloyl-ACP methyl ester carboxylesterase